MGKWVLSAIADAWQTVTSVLQEGTPIPDSGSPVWVALATAVLVYLSRGFVGAGLFQMLVQTLARWLTPHTDHGRTLLIEELAREREISKSLHTELAAHRDEERQTAIEAADCAGRMAAALAAAERAHASELEMARRLGVAEAEVAALREAARRRRERTTRDREPEV